MKPNSSPEGTLTTALSVRAKFPFFGALGPLMPSRLKWRRTVVGTAEEGLYASLALEGHGLLQVHLRPGDGVPTVEVEWREWRGYGPASAKTLYKGVP